MIEEIKAAAFKAEIEKAQQKMHGYKKEIEKFASMLEKSLTPSQKVARSQTRLVNRGGRRLNISLQPDAAQALQELLDAGYGTNRARTAAAVIDRALVEARGRIKKAKPPPATL